MQAFNEHFVTAEAQVETLLQVLALRARASYFLLLTSYLLQVLALRARGVGDTGGTFTLQPNA